jgi:type I restriction enzyme S subunit
MIGKIGIPPLWEVAALEDVCLVIQGQSPPGETYNTERKGLPFFQGKAEFGDIYATPVKWCTAPTKIAERDDVLVSIRAPVGPVNLCPEQACIGRGLAALRPLGGIRPKYIFHAMRHTEGSLAAKGTGSTFEAVSGAQLRSHEIPVAPSGQQTLIVDEIEKQFARLDAAMASLQQVRSKVERYRASILKAACEGRLVPTEAELARARKREYEPAEKLLEHLLVDRRAKWEQQQIDKMRRDGVEPKNDRWRSKYKEPSTPAGLSTSSVPEGWTTVTIGQLAWSVRDGPHFSPAYVEEGVPFITGGNVRPNGVDFDKAKRITPELHRQFSQRTKPEKGDILYTKGGTTGIARVNTYDIEFSVWVHVAVLKLASGVDPFFLQHTLNSPSSYTQAQKFTHGVGNQDLGLTRMVNITFGLPPLAEQRRIVEEVDRRMSILDEVDHLVNASLLRGSRLRQAILRDNSKLTSQIRCNGVVPFR